MSRLLVLGLLWAATAITVSAVNYNPWSEFTDRISSSLERVLENDAFSPASNVSHVCINATKQYLVNLTLEQLWAMKMYDATGRPDGGVLKGGFSFLGYYSECIQAVPEPLESHFQPPFVSSYCLATINTAQLESQQSVHLPKYIWQAAIASQVARVGLCVPSLCSPEDVKELVTMTLQDVVAGSVVLSTSCSETSKHYSSDSSALIMTGALLFFVVLTAIGTFYTFMKENSQQSMDVSTDPNAPKPSESAVSRLLASFSVLANGKKLLHIGKGSDGISVIHGLRMWSILWIIFGHSYSFAQQWVTYRNTEDMRSIPADIISQGIANGTLAVDTFFFISGLLIVYVAFCKMDQVGGKLNLFGFYFHRYWRMTPLMMVVIGICANILPYMAGGPRWTEASSMYDATCRSNWWLNALYLHNFVNTPQMCLNHTWFSAVDMQFYIISPLILIVLYKNRLWGILIIGFLGLSSMAATAIITAVNNYPGMPYISNLVPIEIMNSYMSNIYIKPYCRIGPYLVGMLTGYVLHQTNCRVSFSRRNVILGWSGCIVGMLTVLYAMWNANTGVSLPSVEVASLYGATSRTLWAVGLSWIVLACVSGNGGFINSALSFKALIPFSRLTYSAYIIHPVIMAIFYGSRETVYDYSPSLLIYFALGNIVITYALSFVMSLLFESPLIGIERVLFFKK